MKNFDVDVQVVIARHLARLAKGPDGLTGAAVTVKAAVADDQHSLVDGLVRLIEGGSEVKVGRAMIGLDRLLSRAPSDPVSRSRLVATFEEIRSATGSALKAMVRNAHSVGTYLVTLCVIGALISLLAVTVIIPVFAEMYTNFGAKLPALTRSLLGGGGVAGYLFVILLVAMGFAVGWFNHTLSRCLVSMVSLPRFWLKLPGFRGLAQQFDYTMFLIYAQVLRASGMTAGDAVNAAREACGVDPATSTDILRPAWLSLDIATETGGLDEELDRQARDEVQILNANFAAGLRTLVGVLAAVVFTLIGVLVIALYLPIFKMGTVV